MCTRPTCPRRAAGTACWPPMAAMPATRRRCWRVSSATSSRAAPRRAGLCGWRHLGPRPGPHPRFHMPGHTAGHTVLLVEPEGVAFIGDIDLTGFGPYYGDACSSGGFPPHAGAAAGDSGQGVGHLAPPRRLYRARTLPARSCCFRGQAGRARAAPAGPARRRPADAGAAGRTALAVSAGLRGTLWWTPRPARSRGTAELLADGRVRVDEGGVYRLG